MKVLHSETGLGIIDTLVALILISILIGVAISKYQGMVQEGREVALQVSLVNLRKAVAVYQLTRQSAPGSLKELITERYVVPMKEDTVFSDRYVKLAALDADGYPIDPFGNRYGYDPATGVVRPTTRGYESW